MGVLLSFFLLSSLLSPCMYALPNNNKRHGLLLGFLAFVIYDGIEIPQAPSLLRWDFLILRGCDWAGFKPSRADWKGYG
jgi:hypothetical protein